MAAAVGLMTTACQNFKKGDGGLEYKIVKDNGKPKIQAEDYVIYDMEVLSDRNDSLINSTFELGLPSALKIAPDSVPGRYKGDFITAFTYLGEGDSAVFRLNLDTAAAKSGQPKMPFADKYVTIKLSIRKHLSKASYNDSTASAELNKFFDAELKKLETAEPAKIEKYIASNKLQPKKTASGLQYVVTSEGKGAKPVDGDTVYVNYVGKLTNGKVFDTSIKEEAEKAKLPVNPMRTFEPIKFVLGVDPIIPAWVEGLKLINQGSKATLIIPSSQAYGANGQPQGKIPPYAPLIFDLELVKVVKGKAPEQNPQVSAPAQN